MILILIQLKPSTTATLATEESVNFHKCVSVKFDRQFVQWVLRPRLTSKLADIKLEYSDAYLPKLEKNLSYGFEITDIFCKNEV